MREHSKGSDAAYTYMLLLSSKSQREDLIEGLESGADDYLTKPFDQHELKVRLRAGTRIIDLQRELLAARERAAGAGHQGFSHALVEPVLDIWTFCNGSFRGPRARTGRWAWCWRIWTGSRASTTPSGISPGTPCCANSRGACWLHAALRFHRALRRRGVPDHPARLRRSLQPPARANGCGRRWPMSRC